jgi:hypothetical protein
MLNVSCALIGLFKLIVDEKSLDNKKFNDWLEEQASSFFTAEDASPTYCSSLLDMYRN